MTRILLLTAALLAAAAVVTYIQLDNAGVLAGKRAEQLLARIQAPIPTVSTEETPAPEAPPGSAALPQRVLADLEDYPVMALLTLPKLDISLPVLADCSDDALEMSVCRLTGPSQPGDAGNLVLTGHNYRSGAHFGRLDEMETGDAVVLMDVWGMEYTYRVSEVVTIKPDDLAALDEFEGESGLALLTCTQHANRRLLVRCVMED